MQPERLDILESLVDELMKAEPRTEVVKKYMEESGIEYSDDPVERLNLVLRALHFVESSSKPQND